MKDSSLRGSPIFLQRLAKRPPLRPPSKSVAEQVCRLKPILSRLRCQLTSKGPTPRRRCNGKDQQGPNTALAKTGLSNLFHLLSALAQGVGRKLGWAKGAVRHLQELSTVKLRLAIAIPPQMPQCGASCNCHRSTLSEQRPLPRVPA